MTRREVERELAGTRRLLRYLSSGRARIAGEGRSDHAAVALVRDGEGVRRFRADVLGAAVERGLVVRERGYVSLDASGRAWLKRAMCGGDAFAAQHGDRRNEMREVEGETCEVTVNLAESPLAGLARVKRRDGSPFLDGPLVAAGERLRIDFTRGGLLPGLSANWETGAGRGACRGAGGATDLTDAALGARIRVEHALRAVGPDLAGVLLDVCCFLKGLETVERERDWPVRSAKLMLRTALAALDRHYNPERTELPAAMRRIHRWGAPGYRPSLRQA